MTPAHGGWVTTQEGPCQGSHQAIGKGCWESDGRTLQRGPCRLRQESALGPPFASGPQVCQVLQDGERQRVPHAPEGFWHPL